MVTELLEKAIALDLDQCAAAMGGCERCSNSEKCYTLFCEIDEDRFRQSSVLRSSYTKQFVKLSSTRQLRLHCCVDAPQESS